MTVGFSVSQPVSHPRRFGAEPKAHAEPFGAEKTFFEAEPFPSELAKPKSLGQRLIYGFNVLFNPKKVMTPVEKSLADLVERLSQQIDQDKIRLKDNTIKKRDLYTCQADLLIDGKPYSFARYGHVLKESTFYLISQGEQTQLSLSYELGFEDWNNKLTLKATNRYVRRKALQTMLKLSKAVDAQERAIKKQLEMEAEVARLKEQHKLEQQAAAGKLIRF